MQQTTPRSCIYMQLERHVCANPQPFYKLRTKVVEQESNMQGPAGSAFPSATDIFSLVHFYPTAVCTTVGFAHAVERFLRPKYNDCTQRDSCSGLFLAGKGWMKRHTLMQQQEIPECRRATCFEDSGSAWPHGLPIANA